MIIGKLEPGDRARWTTLWRTYLEFYATVLPDAVFDHTWQRLMEDGVVHGLAAREDGEIIGIVHFLYHASGWTLTPVCYLQDLFTDAEHRGRGTARALINAVAEHARSVDAARLYWLTQSHNEVARVLYDKVAKHTGFIRYEFPLTS